jgi:hypothetical protein
MNMNQKTKKLAYTALLIVIGILTIRVFYSIYSQVTMEGQPTVVNGAVRERGSYIDVLLTIQNNKNTDTSYRWEINFYGDQRIVNSFSDKVKSGSGLMHATSYAAPEDKENIRANIKVYEEDKLIDDRMYYLNDSKPQVIE